ncbi:MAG: hypothetical protein WA958_10195 [Tunicatimonas sp.]
MQQYPELTNTSISAEKFYDEFRAVLPQDKFFTDHEFVTYCDSFQRAYNKFLRQHRRSPYRVNTLIRAYFFNNQGHLKRLALFAIFIKESMEETEEMLLACEYYELMNRFNASREKISRLVSVMMSDSI